MDLFKLIAVKPRYFEKSLHVEGTIARIVVPIKIKPVKEYIIYDCT